MLVTTLATFFIDCNADSEEAEVVGQQSLEALYSIIAALRGEVRELARGRKAINLDGKDQ